MTTRVVTDEQVGRLAKRMHELETRVYNEGVDFDVAWDGLQLLIDNKRVIADPNSAQKDEWLTGIVSREKQHHIAFFGCGFDLAEFENKLRKYGQKQIRRWGKHGFEPHFLPAVAMVQDAELSGWKMKPEAWYYSKVAEGKIFRNVNSSLNVDREAFKLAGITVLVDVRLKPKYADGRQMYDNDYLVGKVVEGLRKAGKIASYNPSMSRFGVSAGEWENEIRPVLAVKLGISASQLRLERAIESNVIPQLYSHMPRKDDGTTNTWEWREEYFEDRTYRLYGGHSDFGGLAGVRWFHSGDRWYHEAFRPLAVL